MKKITYLLMAILAVSACRNHNNKTGYSNGHAHQDCTDHGPRENHGDYGHEKHSSHDHEDCPGHSHEADGHAHEHEYETAHHHSANSVDFGRELRSKLDFATTKVSVGEFTSVIKAVAKVTEAQGRETALIARSSGIVKMISEDGKYPLPGAEVRKDQLLFTIESTGLTNENMDVRYAQAKADYESAKDLYERKAELAKDKVVSESEFKRAKAEYESAKAVYNNLRTNYADGRALIKSSFSGHICSVNVRSGQFVEAGTVLAVLATGENAMITAKLSPRYRRQLENIADANIRGINEEKVYSLKELKGKLESVGHCAEGGSAQIHVIFEIDNSKSKYLPGTFVDIFIKGKPKKDVLSVPSTALVEEMGNYFVYVRSEENDECFEKAQVVTGASDGVNTEIKAGLKGEETVVSRGAIFLKLAQTAGGLDPHAGHVH